MLHIIHYNSVTPVYAYWIICCPVWVGQCMLSWALRRLVISWDYLDWYLGKHATSGCSTHASRLHNPIMLAHFEPQTIHVRYTPIHMRIYIYVHIHIRVYRLWYIVLTCYYNSIIQSVPSWSFVYNKWTCETCLKWPLHMLTHVSQYICCLSLHIIQHWCAS